MPTALSHILLPVIVAVSILLMLFRPLNIAEVWWVSGGAVLLIALRLIPFRLAGHAVAEGVDVYLFLIGMMILAELASEHGVFDWLSCAIVRGARGSCSRLFLLTYLLGTVVTIFLSNDATAVVLTPAILVVIRKARISPLPYLFVCALVANAASFVLPISNPANLVVFREGMPSLGRWLAAFAVPSMIAIASTFAVMRVFFRIELRERIEHPVAAMKLKPSGRYVLWCLGVVTVVLLTASALNKSLGLPTFVAGVTISLAVSLKSKRNPIQLLRGVSWSTIVLVAGLFVLVDAVEAHGALHLAERSLAQVQKLAPSAAALLTGLSLGIANNVVNNLPLGLIAGATIRSAHVTGFLANAAMIGIDLGPNLSVTGSLATILWLIALRKERLDVSGWTFLRLGIVAMPVALAAALGSAILLGKI